VTLLVASLHNVITVKICCFRYRKSVPSLRDVRKIKICCLRYVGKSKHSYTVIDLCSLLVYHLPTNTLEFFGYFQQILL